MQVGMSVLSSFLIVNDTKQLPEIKLLLRLYKDIKCKKEKKNIYPFAYEFNLIRLKQEGEKYFYHHPHISQALCSHLFPRLQS